MCGLQIARLSLSREWVGIDVGSCGRELRAGTIPISSLFFSEDDWLPCPQRESPSKRKPWSFNRGRLQPLACPEQSLPLIGSNHLIRFFSLFLLPSAKFLHCVGNHLVWLIEQACSSFSLGLYIGHIIPISGHKVDRY
jgi:hypothetical protein